jgi:uncharacterized membrane protein
MLFVCVCVHYLHELKASNVTMVVVYMQLENVYINFIHVILFFLFISAYFFSHHIMVAKNSDIKEKGNTKDPEQKSLWTRYALWLLVPIMLAVYFSQDNAVLAQIKNERQVLPNNVKPLHYDLELTPNLETFVYDGKVKIK